MSIIGNLRTQHVTGKNILDQQKTKTSATIVSRNDELSWLFSKRFRAFHLICMK